MRCPGCSGDNAPGATVCQYCGAHLPQAAKGDRRAVFARIKDSPQYAQRNLPERHARLPKLHAAHKAFAFGFPILFVGVTLFIFVMMLGASGVFGFAGFDAGGGFGAMFAIVPLVMSLVPLGMAVFGVFLFVTLQKKVRALETAPVEAAPVIVIDKRTHVSGSKNTHTRYFATCETEDGARHEYPVWDGNLYGRMATQDAGVVYLRADHALDFDRVPT